MNIDGIRLTPKVLEWALLESRLRFILYRELLGLTDSNRLDRPKVHGLMKERLEHYKYLPVALAYRLDHIYPLSKGGTHEPDNVAVSHPKCNMNKKTSIEFGGIKKNG